MFDELALFQTKGIDPVLLVEPDNPDYRIAANYLDATGLSSLVGQPPTRSPRACRTSAVAGGGSAERWARWSG